jgi:hypothetical protein
VQRQIDAAADTGSERTDRRRRDQDVQWLHWSRNTRADPAIPRPRGARRIWPQ